MKKPDSNQLSLVTAPILGQPPRVISDNMHSFIQLRSKSQVLAVLLPVLLTGCQLSSMGLFRTEVEIDAPREFLISDNSEMFGNLAVIYTRDGDTLPDIARHFGLGFDNITKANPDVDIWTPSEGSGVLLPMRFILPKREKKGIVLNLASLRFFLYNREQSVRMITFPVGIGSEGWSTPTGTTRIVGKKVDPAWYVPASILREHAAKGDPLPRVVPPGPDNPLGRYAMRLGMPRYLIHGTNKPYGIGMRVSHGCVRLYPEDIETLFERTAVKTMVRIVDQPYLTAWYRGNLYLEVHKPFKNDEKAIEKLGLDLRRKLLKISHESNLIIDWKKVERILGRANGGPNSNSKGNPRFHAIAQPTSTRGPSRSVPGGTGNFADLFRRLGYRSHTLHRKKRSKKIGGNTRASRSPDTFTSL